MGGRGASSSNIPTATPGGGGGGGNGLPMDQFPGSPETLKEALGTKGRLMSIYNAVMKANPFYDKDMTTAEYNANCQRAVVATGARMRGYNVIAQPTYDGDTLPQEGEWQKSFKNAKTESVGRTTAAATQKTLEQKMKDYGDGARAIVAVEWKGRGAEGHVLNAIQKTVKRCMLMDKQESNIPEKPYLRRQDRKA